MHCETSPPRRRTPPTSAPPRRVASPAAMEEVTTAFAGSAYAPRSQRFIVRSGANIQLRPVVPRRPLLPSPNQGERVPSVSPSADELRGQLGGDSPLRGGHRSPPRSIAVCFHARGVSLHERADDVFEVITLTNESPLRSKQHQMLQHGAATSTILLTLLFRRMNYMVFEALRHAECAMNLSSQTSSNSSFHSSSAAITNETRLESVLRGEVLSILRSANPTMDCQVEISIVPFKAQYLNFKVRDDVVNDIEEPSIEVVGGEWPMGVEVLITLGEEPMSPLEQFRGQRSNVRSATEVGGIAVTKLEQWILTHGQDAFSSTKGFLHSIFGPRRPVPIISKISINERAVWMDAEEMGSNAAQRNDSQELCEQSPTPPAFSEAALTLKSLPVVKKSIFAAPSEDFMSYHDVAAVEQITLMPPPRRHRGDEKHNITINDTPGAYPVVCNRGDEQRHDTIPPEQRLPTDHTTISTERLLTVHTTIPTEQRLPTDHTTISTERLPTDHDTTLTEQRLPTENDSIPAEQLPPEQHSLPDETMAGKGQAAAVKSYSLPEAIDDALAAPTIGYESLKLEIGGVDDVCDVRPTASNFPVTEEFIRDKYPATREAPLAPFKVTAQPLRSDINDPDAGLLPSRSPSSKATRNGGGLIVRVSSSPDRKEDFYVIGGDRHVRTDAIISIPVTLHEDVSLNEVNDVTENMLHLLDDIAVENAIKQEFNEVLRSMQCNHETGSCCLESDVVMVVAWSARGVGSGAVIECHITFLSPRRTDRCVLTRLQALAANLAAQNASEESLSRKTLHTSVFFVRALRAVACSLLRDVHVSHSAGSMRTCSFHVSPPLGLITSSRRDTPHAMQHYQIDEGMADDDSVVTITVSSLMQTAEGAPQNQRTETVHAATVAAEVPAATLTESPPSKPPSNARAAPDTATGSPLVIELLVTNNSHLEEPSPAAASEYENLVPFPQHKIDCDDDTGPVPLNDPPQPTASTTPIPHNPIHMLLTFRTMDFTPLHDAIAKAKRIRRNRRTARFHARSDAVRGTHTVEGPRSETREGCDDDSRSVVSNLSLPYVLVEDLLHLHKPEEAFLRALHFDLMEAFQAICFDAEDCVVKLSVESKHTHDGFSPVRVDVVMIPSSPMACALSRSDVIRVAANCLSADNSENMPAEKFVLFSAATEQYNNIVRAFCDSNCCDFAEIVEPLNLFETILEGQPLLTMSLEESVTAHLQ